METLDSTIVNTALPSMAHSLGASPLLMQSVIIAYSLTLAVLIPASGWIADRFGTRRAFLTAILVFTCGSLLCAVSRSLPELVASRVLQGLGGSMLMPIGRLAVLRAFPGEKFLAAMGFVTVPALIGPLVGPTLGGWLVEFASWHWIFLINIPIGVAGWIATRRAMPDLRAEAPARFDLTGFVQLSVGMVTISLALDGLAELGFEASTVMLLLITGFSLIAAYGFHASHVPNPLFPLRLFKVRTFTLGLLGNIFARLGSSGMPFLIPLFFQVCLGFNPFEAGVLMLPVAIAGIFAKRIATPLIPRLGYRRVLVGNTFLVGAGIASFASVAPGQSLWLRIPQLLFFGCVNSLQFTAMNTLTLKNLKPRDASSGNTLFSMVQMLAMSVAVAAAAALLNAFMKRIGAEGQSLSAFHATFLCMGAMTVTSSWIFWQLSEEPDAVAAQAVPNIETRG